MIYIDVTQILREIKFEDLREIKFEDSTSTKSLITHLGALNF